MWALIMTLHFYIYADKPSLIIVLDNFENEKACLYAGAQQETELRQSFGISKQYTFICVKKD